MRFDDGVRRYETRRPFEGVITNMERRYRETDSDWIRDELARYQSRKPCEACGGYRLKPEALAVKIAGLHIGELVQQSISQAVDWFGELSAKLTDQQNEIATGILKEIRERLGYQCRPVLSDPGTKLGHAQAAKVNASDWPARSALA